MDIGKTIGKNIRYQAKHKGIRLADLSLKIGSDPKHLTQIIDNDNIKVKTLYQIANVIGCNITDLLGIPSYQITADNSVINVVIQQQQHTTEEINNLEKKKNR